MREEEDRRRPGGDEIETAWQGEIDFPKSVRIVTSTKLLN
jgi:hypothetical protein